MTITFSRNHNGDPLVLVNGNVQAVAKDCAGWDYVKAHTLAFSNHSQIQRDGKAEVVFVDAWDCEHTWSLKGAARELKEYYDAWPGGLEEIESATKRVQESQAVPSGWISVDERLHPEAPGLKRYEQIPCLIIKGREVLIRVWNCQHLVWDDEDGDDFYCAARDITHWMPLPAPPIEAVPGEKE